MMRLIKIFILFFLSFCLVSIARADLRVETGQFAVNTGGSTTTVTTGFQGKAVILYTHGKTATGESAGASFSFGFSNGTSFKCTSWSGDDAVSTTNTGKYFKTNTALGILTDGTPTLGTGGTVTGVAFNATPNMVLTFDTTPASAWLVNYILIGGSDITNVFVGGGTQPTVTGNKSYTGVGFQGDAIFLLGRPTNTDGTGVNAHNGIGFATTSTRRWAFTQTVTDAQSTSAGVDGLSAVRNTKAFSTTTTGATTRANADFVSFDTDGFTLNFSIAPSTADLISYMVIKGGRWDGEVSAKPATATTQTVTGMAFQPLAVGFLMSSATALNTLTSNAISTVGMATATAQNYAGAYHNDAINSVAKSAGNTNALLHEMNATANATWTSFNSDGWTITWDAAGTAYQVAWWAVAANASGNQVGSAPSSLSVSVGATAVGTPPRTGVTAHICPAP